MKKCGKCGEEKELSEYYVRSDSRGTHYGTCKACLCARSLERYHAHRDEYLAKVKTPEWRERRRARNAERKQQRRDGAA